MSNFITQLDEKLAFFEPFSTQTVQLNSPLFRHQQATVAQFLAEIRQTAQILCRQTEADYSQHYAKQLIEQVDILRKQLEQRTSQTAPATFQSTYRFPRNIHRLPPEKRLPEYKKALRALNEKLSWLSEQLYSSPLAVREQYTAQITETEYRKQKCLAAIDELEQFIAKR